MSVQKNTSIDKRSGTLELYNTTTNEPVSIVVLEQSGRAKRNPSWSLGDTETYTKDSTGINFTVSDPDNVGYRIKVSEAWMINRNNKIYCRENLNGSSRTGTVQLISTDGSTVYATCTVTQESKILPSWDVPTTFHFDSIGQSDLSPTGLDLNISDPDNVGWTIEGPSYVGNSLVSGDQLPISDTGNKSLSLGPDVNTSSERTFDLVLKASTGAVMSTCSCTQDASESVEDLSWDLPEIYNCADAAVELPITLTDSMSVG